MDLDKLLASLQATADEALSASPLIAVANYLPPKGRPGKKAEAGSRRLVAAFLLWLASREWLSAEASGKLTHTGFVLSLESATQALQGTFSDALHLHDIAADVQPFCRHYLAPAPGGFADDFHNLFVEGTRLDSFLDVVPAQADLERLCAWIDDRLSRYRQGDPAWQQPFSSGDAERLQAPSVGQQTFSLDAWRARLRAFDDLEAGPGGLYRERSAAYLKTLDEAAGRAEPEVADELIRSYRFHRDRSIQSNAWRLLRARPPMEVLAALLRQFVDISQTTAWASELVDVFEDGLPAATLDRMADALDAQPLELRVAYTTALKQAEREGSRHAAQLLRVIYPHEE